MLRPMSPSESLNLGVALGSSSGKLGGIISNKGEWGSSVGTEGSGDSGS